MKTISDLMQVTGEAIARNGRNGFNHWFIDFSGHVNKMRIRYYPCGWSNDAISEGIEQKITEEGIQALYWFIKTRL